MEAGLARRLLAALVLVSFAVRTGLAWLQATPVYYPDEYLYSALSRSLVESGRPLVRGADVSMPALLTPLLDAPAWLAGSVELVYRLVQAEHSLAISLSAIPVYWLARLLDVDRRRALAPAALTLAIPDLIFSSFLLSESFALPLFLAAVCAAVSAVGRGGTLRWAGFAALATLAAAARLQFVVLLPLALIAGIAVEARGRRRVAALRLAGGLVALVAAVGVAAVAAGPTRVLGIYGGLTDAQVDAGSLAKWGAFNGILLLAAAGWVIAPGAVLGIARAAARPRDRLEEAFAYLAVLLLAVLLAQGAFFNAHGLQLMERYTFYAVPLLLVGFVVAWSRGLLRSRAHAGLGLALVGTALAFLPRFPEFFYTQPDHAPSLLAYSAVESLLQWRAPLVCAGVAAALGAGTLLLGRRGHGSAIAALGAVVVVALAAGAQLRVKGIAASTARAQGGSLAFVDGADVQQASYLTFANTDPADAQQVAFWNRSVVRVLRFSGASGDGYASTSAMPATDGRLLVDGRPLSHSLVVDRRSAFVRFDRPPLVRNDVAELFGPRPMLRRLVDGYLREGDWLAPRGVFAAWPSVPGRPLRGSLTLRVWSEHRSRIRLEGPACSGSLLVTEEPRMVTVPFDTSGPWRCAFSVEGKTRVAGGRFVTVHARILRFQEDRGPDAA